MVAAIDLKVADSETIGLVGPSGSGESTQVCLMIGPLRSTLGSIAFDGIETRQLDLRRWRQQDAVVPSPISARTSSC